MTLQAFSSMTMTILIVIVFAFVIWLVGCHILTGDGRVDPSTSVEGTL